MILANSPREPMELPPFTTLAKSALAANALILGLLLLTGRLWLALGAICGAVIGLAIFWSLHLISRTIVASYLDGERERRGQPQSGTEVAGRRSALARLAGMLVGKYALLTLAMFGVFQIAKSHLIPFLLTFIGTFALTQIAIVGAAAKAMRPGK